MVDSSPHREADGIARSQRSFLQVSPWEHQRDAQHEATSRGHSHGTITPSPCVPQNCTSHLLMPQAIRLSLSSMDWSPTSIGGCRARVDQSDDERQRWGIHQRRTKRTCQEVIGRWTCDIKRRKMAQAAKTGQPCFSWREPQSELLSDGMTPSMIAAVEMMLDRWRNYVGKEIEVFQEFKLLTSEVISRTAFGNSYLEGENMFHMLTKLAQIVSRTALTIQIPIIGRIFKTRDDIEAEELEQGIRNSIIKIIRTREESVKTGKERSYGSDFLGSLLNAYHSDDKAKKISLDDLVDECKTFYIAGQETTLTLLSWIVLLLAIHTEWQDKARQEVLESFGQENPNTQGISRLTTMGMIINETLRLYTPVVNILRKVEKEVRVGDVIVPANMNINISTLALHHNTKIWGEDAHMFKPERFAEGVAKATNNNTATYIPFGLGPRTCVGLNFATNETKIALSMILQRFKFTLSPNYVHSPVQLLTVRPQHGLQIILQKL